MQALANMQYLYTHAHTQKYTHVYTHIHTRTRAHALTHAYAHESARAHTQTCAHCKERYKGGLLWAGRGTIPVNELA